MLAEGLTLLINSDVIGLRWGHSISCLRKSPLKSLILRIKQFKCGY